LEVRELVVKNALWCSVFVVVTLLAALPSYAQDVASEQVLFSFAGVNGGTYPYAGVVRDASGNLYGTTYGDGGAYELSKGANGTWSVANLHRFDGSNPGPDGVLPFAGVILDVAGNLYGTTLEGGTTGSGTVFELAKDASGVWTCIVLYSFAGGTDGVQPYGTLLMDKAGNLFGTTWAGGASWTGGVSGSGTVFELSKNSIGIWTKSILHSFGTGKDGQYPYVGVVMDGSGRLYGTTQYGGAHGEGIVFQLIKGSNGKWAEHVLHSFGSGMDGAQPQGEVVLDGKGNLYSTTLMGGQYGKGVVYEVKRGTAWTEVVLHSFGGGVGANYDGSYPQAGLVKNGRGGFFGTTAGSGASDAGKVFELSPVSGGAWVATVLHSFGSGADGQNPSAGPLIRDAAGKLYGTTFYGGDNGLGTVFEITP
jgi:uncharacterized repeat protein (TIGR03803 family)